MAHCCPCFAQSDMNAIFSPSGCHAGAWSLKRPEVSRLDELACPVDASHRVDTPNSPFRWAQVRLVEYNISRPFGEN